MKKNLLILLLVPLISFDKMVFQYLKVEEE